METAGSKGRSRRQKPKSQSRKDKRVSHFQTVRRGGFEESQVICRLWDIVKALEAGRKEIETVPEPVMGFMRKTVEGPDINVRKAGHQKLEELEKQLRRQIRVEMRRYFARRRRRNVNLLIRGVLLAACVVCLFTAVIGIDRVSGESMYPYLNHGDWILFSRINREYHRDDVVVFEKNGENLVKRIAGLPGDIVRISASGNQVEINGEWVEEPHVLSEDKQSVSKLIASGEAGNVQLPGKYFHEEASAKEMYSKETLSEEASSEGMTGGQGIDQMGAPQTVMDGQYLVLGDNRRVSIDSRSTQMGTVSEEEILGRVILVLRIKERDKSWRE